METYIITLVRYNPSTIMTEREYILTRGLYWSELRRRVLAYLLEKQICIKYLGTIPDLSGRFLLEVHPDAWPIIRQHQAVQNIAKYQAHEVSK